MKVQTKILFKSCSLFKTFIKQSIAVAFGFVRVLHFHVLSMRSSQTTIFKIICCVIWHSRFIELLQCSALMFGNMWKSSSTELTLNNKGCWDLFFPLPCKLYTKTRYVKSKSTTAVTLVTSWTAFQALAMDSRNDVPQYPIQWVRI